MQGRHGSVNATIEPNPSRAPHHPGCGTGRSVWLFRHGAVDAVWRGRIYGGLDVPLSRTGRQASRRLARAFRPLGFEHILSSPLARARVLARLLSAATGSPLTVEPDLREIERGRWAGRAVAEIERTDPEEVEGFRERSWTYNDYGGESDGDVWRRAWPVFEAHVAAGSGPLAVVCHFNVARILAACALGISARDSFRLRLDVTRAIELVDHPDGWRLRQANVTAPLR